MDWQDILGLSEPVTVDDVIARHRALAKKYHPDLGGSDELMQTINAAKDAALADLDDSWMHQRLRRIKHPDFWGGRHKVNIWVKRGSG